MRRSEVVKFTAEHASCWCELHYQLHLGRNWHGPPSAGQKCERNSNFETSRDINYDDAAGRFGPRQLAACMGLSDAFIFDCWRAALDYLALGVDNRRLGHSSYLITSEVVDQVLLHTGFRDTCSV